jgi:hypothetical protein
VAFDVDRALLDKAADVTAMALRGAMGGPDSKPASYAAEVFREVWGAMKDAAKEIPERSRAGF